jgi:hypothetical protein
MLEFFGERVRSRVEHGGRESREQPSELLLHAI